ncbi:MAG: YggT family protein [Bdellovibrionales bacterium]
MVSLFLVIDLVLNLYLWAIIIGAILSWLIAFNVINAGNQLVYTINDFLHRITEPALARIRRYVPMLQGIDLSPIVLILIVVFIRSLLREYGPL